MLKHEPNHLYLNWRPELPEPPLEPGTAALTAIDMQHADVSLNRGIFAKKQNLGLEAGLDYFRDQLDVIVPNIQMLQKACRQAGVEVIFPKSSQCRQMDEIVVGRIKS